jgi:hypothetical protein
MNGQTDLFKMLEDADRDKPGHADLNRLPITKASDVEM